MDLHGNKSLEIVHTSENLIPPDSDVIVIRDCYCPNGHDLVTNRAKFGDHDGIVIGVRGAEKIGYIALSPLYGDKSRICIDYDLKEGELLSLICPQCQVQLPTYAVCECGGVLVVMFTKPEVDYKNLVGICNRVGCKHAEIKNEGQLMALISENDFI
ncbi:MAG: hypothetical protein HXX13_00660 [Bacteroidetes bacterium]|nr:hypothetical protein [Bacteroidota bacterium]